MLNYMSLKYFIYCLVFVFLLPNILYAADNEINSGSGFTIEPAISHVSVGRGMILKSGLSIKNQGDLPITITISVEDFESKDDFGGVKLLGVGDKDDQISASGWISYPKEKLIIPAKEKLIVPYSISVPDDASFGGRSVVFIIESSGGNIHSKVNTLCFLTVPGDAKEDLLLNNFSFYPFITPRSTGNLHIELKNAGKTHARPEGFLVIRNMFGIERGRYELINENSLGTIIPTAKRSSDYSWEGSMNSFDFGLWNAKIELKYGTNGDHLISDRAFFLVLPWKALLLTIIILGGSISFFIYSTRKLRKKISDYKEIELNDIEREVSLKLLLIPFISGLLLLITIVISMYSVLEKKGDGQIKKIQINKGQNI